MGRGSRVMCARSGTHGTPGRLQIGHITATRPIRMPAPQRIPPGLLHGPCRVAIPGQWWLPRLRGPVRLALLEVLTFRGPLTATEAGQLIEESPTTCSFHLRQLAKYGFVEEGWGGAGRRRNSGRRRAGAVILGAGRFGWQSPLPVHVAGPRLNQGSSRTRRRDSNAASFACSSTGSTL